jgi:hypothetical protein
VILHTDIPTRAEVDRLLANRNPASVSLYVATDPASTGEAERIELRNLWGEGAQQLQNAGVGRADVAAIEEEVADLVDDEEFWRYQARSLATFLTPEQTLTFRLPNRLVSAVEVSDRFHVKPLMRAMTFPQAAFVLALSQNMVRVVEVSADDEPTEVRLPDMPQDAADFARKASLSDRAPVRRIQGSEGRKLRLRQYARAIDQALRPFLAGQEVPLILAATEPLDSIYRSVSSYPHLAGQRIGGNPEAMSDGELAANARRALDELYAEQLQETRRLFEQRRAEGRGLTDVGDVARAATAGAVNTVFVDSDAVVTGSVDEHTGAVTLAEDSDPARPDHYGVVDEIVRRAWLAGGKVLAVRRQDIPGEGSVAAILRYPI